MEIKLPWELIEEVLSRVPPKTLGRFKAVSKQWNSLFNDKTFIYNHKSTFRFILATKSKIYSVSIDPKIEIHELNLEIPGFETCMPKSLIECNGFLLCNMDKGALLLNPWLRQSRWIKPEFNQPNLRFYGIGDGSCYKTLASYRSESNPNITYWKTHDFASGTDHEFISSDSTNSSTQGVERFAVSNTTSVSLDGCLYLVVSSYDKTGSFFLANFMFSNERFFKFCDLPCGDNHHEDSLVLRLFKEDRFSLLKQSHLTNKIEIWVTKNKIDKWLGRNVEWVMFMEVSAPNTPSLRTNGYGSRPSYYIEDKRLVVCSCDENCQAWVYVMGNNKFISTTKLDLVVDACPWHCTYFPSLVSVPPGQREEQAEVQV
ncbi:unnamed protein product [Cochlearia groenlandica]